MFQFFVNRYCANMSQSPHHTLNFIQSFNQGCVAELPTFCLGTDHLKICKSIGPKTDQLLNYIGVYDQDMEDYVYRNQLSPVTQRTAAFQDLMRHWLRYLEIVDDSISHSPHLSPAPSSMSSYTLASSNTEGSYRDTGVDTDEEESVVVTVNENDPVREMLTPELMDLSLMSMPIGELTYNFADDVIQSNNMLSAFGLCGNELRSDSEEEEKEVMTRFNNDLYCHEPMFHST